MNRALLIVLGASCALPACTTNDVYTDTISTETAGGSGGRASGGRGGSGGQPRGTGGGGPSATGGSGAGQGGAPMPPPPTGSGGSAGDAGPIEAGAVNLVLKVTGAATWKGNAAGAYSIVHEVVCDSSLVKGPFDIADPELKMRNLRGGFGLIVNRCEAANLWGKVNTLVANGHDVFSHTFNHRCLAASAAAAAGCEQGVMRSTDYATEIDRAAMMLEERTGVKPGFILFPYDVCDAGAVTRAKQRGYLGARCSQGMNASDFPDPFKVAFDLWGPAWSGYRTMGSQCAGVNAQSSRPNQASAACRQHVLSRYVEDAITRKGWALRGFHGFDADSGSFEPVSTADYRSHLDFVAGKVASGELWVDGPGRVVRYRMARQHCPVPTFDAGVLKFTAPNPDCTKHATEVSYLVATEGADPAALAVSQGGQRIAARKLGVGNFVLDLDPTKGDATVVP